MPHEDGAYVKVSLLYALNLAHGTQEPGFPARAYRERRTQAQEEINASGTPFSILDFRGSSTKDWECRFLCGTQA